jgi:hypothetical protein
MIILMYEIQGVPVPSHSVGGKTVNAQYYESILQYHLYHTLRQMCPELSDNATETYPELTENAISLHNTR